jgi:hypothetical protein
LREIKVGTKPTWAAARLLIIDWMFISASVLVNFLSCTLFSSGSPCQHPVKMAAILVCSVQRSLSSGGGSRGWKAPGTGRLATLPYIS